MSKSQQAFAVAEGEVVRALSSPQRVGGATVRTEAVLPVTVHQTTATRTDPTLDSGGSRNPHSDCALRGTISTIDVVGSEPLIGQAIAIFAERFFSPRSRAPRNGGRLPAWPDLCGHTTRNRLGQSLASFRKGLPHMGSLDFWRRFGARSLRPRHSSRNSCLRASVRTRTPDVSLAERVGFEPTGLL